MTNDFENLKELGPKLIAKGYPICGIAPGTKHPDYPNWQNVPLDESGCASLGSSYGVGILCGMKHAPICGVDVDVMDEEFVKVMHDVIITQLQISSMTPRRIGKAPKFLMMFKAESPDWGKGSTPVFMKDGVKAQIEFLSRGQQFVASAIHPETNKPYAWTDIGSIAELPSVKDLPTITLEDIEAITKAFCDYAESHGWIQASGMQTVRQQDAAMSMLTPVTPPMYDMPVGLMRLILEKLVAVKALDLGRGTHDEWIRLGMAIHHQTGGSAEGLQLWDDISALFPEAYDRLACADRWGTFKDDRSDGVTFRRYHAMYARLMYGPVAYLNEFGIAHRLAKVMGDKAVYISQINDWYCFNEDRGNWERNSGYALIIRYLRAIYDGGLLEEAKLESDKERREELLKLRTKCLNRARATESNVMTLLAGMYEMHGTLEEFDRTPNLVGVTNGVVDIATRTLVPNNASLRVLRQAGTAYDPEAKCPTWERTILEWFDGDMEKVKYVQRLLGQALTGAPKEDVFVLLRGIGCNGKSVFLNTLASVFGGYAEVISEATLVGYAEAGQGGQARSDLVKLRGARFVYCSETSSGMRLKEADVKRMTGRDSISARAPYGRADVVITPQWLLCVGTNHVPEVKGDDEGIWRRIADVEFPRNFLTDKRKKMDTNLTDSLKTELSGILNWIIDGYDAWMKIGLAMPASIKISTEEYREEMDDVKAWATQRLRPVQDEEARKGAPVQMFYSDFKQWAKAQGVEIKLSQNAFTRRLKKYFQSLGESQALYRSMSVQRVRHYSLAPENDTADAFEVLTPDPAPVRKPEDEPPYLSPMAREFLDIVGFDLDKTWDEYTEAEKAVYRQACASVRAN